MIETQLRGVAVAFEEVNIEGDDDLEMEYGIRIPVVEIDGLERFEIDVDAAELAAIIRGSGGDPETL